MIIDKRNRFLYLLLILAFVSISITFSPKAATRAVIEGTKYTDLHDAVKKVKSGQTVELVRDLPMHFPLTLSNGSSFTIDGKNHALYFDTISPIIIVKSGTKVKFKNIRIENSKSTDGYYPILIHKGSYARFDEGIYKVPVKNNGKVLFLNNCKFDYSAGSGVTFTNNGTCMIKSGYFTSAYGRNAVYNSAGAIMIIRNGEFFGDTDTADYHTIVNQGYLVIHGGACSGGLVNEKDGRLYVDDDKLYSDYEIETETGTEKETETETESE